MTSALVIPADASTPPFLVQLPESDPAAALRLLLGGALEGVYGETDDGQRITLYANDDSRELGLLHNPVASLLWSWTNPAAAGQSLAGTVVAVGVDGCDEADVPERLVHAVRQLREALIA